MNSNELIRMVKMVPFTPFEMMTSGGEKYVIRHPECLIVGKTTSLIVQRDPQTPGLYRDDYVRIPNLHVNHIRLLTVDA